MKSVNNPMNMKLIRPLALAFLVLIAVQTLKSQVSKGEGNLKTEIRELVGFNEIIAQGRFDLTLVQGEKEGIRIETNENLLDFFQTRVDGKTLYISMTADIRKYTALNVTVSIKDLKKIILLNEISLSSNSVIHFDELSIFSGGMSKLNLEVYATKLDVQIADGTYAYFKGYAESLIVKAHDETELNAFDMESENCQILSSGLTEVMVNVQKDLKLMVSGSSNVYYIGQAEISERIFSSTGFIVKRKKTE